MDPIKTMFEISAQIKRIRATIEPNAAIRVEAGKAQYVTETPRPDGYFDCVEISDWMPVTDIAGYCEKIH